MSIHRLMLAAGAAMALGATAAAADCREELAQLKGGIAKDGSMAPLEPTTGATPQTGEAQAGATQTEGAATGEGVAKDGTIEPLAADPSLATSGQDAAAQQEGGATAAEQAAGAPGAGQATDRDQAIADAEAALAAGDEAGCMEALEAAKGM